MPLNRNIAKGELQAFPSSLCCCPWFPGPLYADSACVCLSSVILFRVLEPLVVTGREVFSTCLLSISQEHTPRWTHSLPSLLPFRSQQPAAAVSASPAFLILGPSSGLKPFSFSPRGIWNPFTRHLVLTAPGPFWNLPHPRASPSRLPRLLSGLVAGVQPDWPWSFEKASKQTNTKLWNAISCVSDVRHCVPWTHF